MDGLVNVPGSFPQYESTSNERPKPTRSSSAILDQQFQDQFANKQVLIRKTKCQHELLIQLDGLIKILVGFQFVKYYHSSCITPLVLRATFITLLAPSQVTTNEGNFYLQSMTRDVDLQSVRQEVKRLIVTNFCRAFYLMSLMISVYYIITTFTWLIPLADSGRLSELQHGSWFFISFIGESTPEDIVPEMNIWLKLYKLGFPGLVLTECTIVLLQLTLFQCIYKQSTMGDRHLHEDEMELVRTPKDLLSLPSNTNADALEVPNILKVKIYEVLDVDSYQLH